MRAYARRNLIAHGENFDPFTSERFEELANHIEDDNKNLESLLFDKKFLVDEYRRLLILYRNSHIRMKGGEWMIMKDFKDYPLCIGDLMAVVGHLSQRFEEEWISLDHPSRKLSKLLRTWITKILKLSLKPKD